MTDEKDFWNFSLSVYDRARDSCLKLQDGFGFDVNLLLFCCWRGGFASAIDEAELARIIEAGAGWRANVLEPLRATRRWLKKRDHPMGADNLGRRVLELELEGERFLQILIVGAAEPLPRRARPHQDLQIEIARRNLEIYQRAVLRDVSTGDEPSFLELLEGVFASGKDEGIVAGGRNPGSPKRRNSESESETG